MKRTGKAIAGRVILAALLSSLLLCLMAGCGGIREVPTEESYSYVNPDESKAQTDEGIIIDGVLDETAYQNNNWLYLHNDDGGNNVSIAMTSHYGEKGMYFVYDVTETVPIYVNLQRASYMNSCIEMYFAPSSVTSLKENSYFEVDMMPTGDMVFKKSNGKGGYVNVATTDDIMAHLGATTKGGEVNSDSCYGYCLELFIPWEYMNWLGLDAQAMKESFVYVDPAHITSFNFGGTDTSVDRYWYFYAQQQGAGFSDVYQYFRFNGSGVMGTVPIQLEAGEHCVITGDASGIPGMETTVTVKAEDGYALSSVLINGEEYLQNLHFDSDGTVKLTTRIPTEGLTVSAKTEPVTEGNKTLSGKVSVLKSGGGSLEGVLVTYIGPTGEKPVELAGDGSFILTDLKQGHYTLKAEKEGFTAVSRGIYLNRDSYAELNLEYDTFYAERGTCWVLDQQNQGILKKFGGTGYLLSTDSYGSFTFEANFRYDEALAQEAQTDFFRQQRGGMRILFSNGKYWHIDLLKENDNYIVQYAKHSGDGSVFGWKTICTMNEAQAAAYCSDGGIKLTVVRNGQYAGVFLGESLLTIEKLADEYASCTAQLGFEFWIANRTVAQIPYAISAANQVDVANAFFLTAKGWDVSGQFDGYVVLTEGGRGDLAFAKKYADMDLTLTVRDYDDPKGTAARNDVLLVFDNEAHISFGITSDEKGAWIQALNKSADDGKQIVKRFAHLGALTEEEFALYKKEGVDFRIVRAGTEVSLYIGERLVRVVDLTGNESGVTADMMAAVTFRHYDDAGVQVKLPFKMIGSLAQVDIHCVETEFGKVATNKQSYVLGDTVILSDSGEGDYYCTGITVDGKSVELTADGTYSFVAEKESYTVEGSFAPRIFRDSAKWQELKQCDGILTVPGGEGDSGWIDSHKTYGDLDLSLTVRDQKNADGNFRAAVRLSFENDKNVTFSLTNAKADDDAADVYDLQNMGDSFYGWKSLYTLTREQAAKLTDDGLTLRVVRVGAVVDIYVDGVHAYEYDLTVDREGQASEVSDKKAMVSLRMYGNKETEVQAGFALKDTVQKVTLDVKTGENGAIATDQKTYILGDTVVLSSDNSSAYYCTGIQVDGKIAELDSLGGYSFVAEKESYAIAGSFAGRIFKGSTEWNGAKQNEGILSVPESDGDSGWIDSYASYGELDMTVKLQDLHSADDNYRAAIRLNFANGQAVTFSLTNEHNDEEEPGNIYALQNMGDSFYGWKSRYTLTEAQSAKLQSEGIDLRVVRVGAIVDIYVDGVHAYEYDLTADKDGNPSGVEAENVTVSLRLYGNAGETVILPFAMTDSVEEVKLQIEESDKGSVTADQKTYILGDTVILSSGSEGAYYCAGFTVDGKPAELDSLGGCSFVAEKESYEISASFAERVFHNSNKWNGAKQNEGILSIPESDGDSGWIDSYASYGELDMTVKLQDLHSAEDNYRAAIRLNFANGQAVTFSLTNEHNDEEEPGNIYALQNMGDSFYGWKSRYALTEAQSAKLQSEGIDLRIVRVGAIVDIYVDGVHAYEYDLTADKDGNPSGVEAENVTVSLRLYGNAGETVILPFAMTDSVEEVKLQIEESDKGSVTADQKTYILGDTVILSSGSEGAYYCAGFTVDGKPAELDSLGGYSFVAEKESYAIAGSFAGRIFKGSTEWNGAKQNEGILSVPGSDGDSGWIDSYASYGELDMTVKLQDLHSAEDNYRAAIRLNFANGQAVTFSLTNEHNDEEEPGNIYALQNMGDSFYGWKSRYTLTEAQSAKLQGEGIDLRVVRVGAIVDIYVDGVHAYEYDLTADKDGNPSGVEAENVTVSLRLYGNAGETVILPFAMTDSVEEVKLQIEESDKGSVTADQKTYILGDTVILSSGSEGAYYCAGFTVDGKPAELDSLGGCSFVAEKEGYEISASFAERVFHNSNKWNGAKQNEGILSIPESDGDSGWIDSYASYGELDMTVKLQDLHSAEDNYRAAIRLNFANGQAVTFSLTNEHNDEEEPGNIYALQNMGDSFYGWKSRYALTEAQSAKLQSEGIDLRIVRVGAIVDIYVDGVHAYEYDLTADKDGNPSGVEAENVTVSLRLYGNAGETVILPFAMTDSVEEVKLQIEESDYSTVTADQKNYLMGETVLLRTDSNIAYYCTSLLVDGSPVQPDAFGSYSFTAEKAGYTVAGSFADKVFNGSEEWDTIRQNEGVLTVPGSDGDSGWIESYASCNELDLKLMLKDLHTADDNYRAAVRLSFANGQYVTFSLTNDRSNEDDPAVYELQNMGGTIHDWARVRNFSLSAEQVAKLQTEGLELRVIRSGAVADIYVDGIHAYEFDLALDKDGNASGVSDQACKLSLRLYGNAGETAELPFILTDSVNMAAVQIAEDERNAITTSQKNYLMGETVEVFNDSASAYYFTALNVDGEPVQLNAFGTYSFTAEKESYALSGSFAEKVFDPAAEWNAIRQNEGILSVPGSDGDSGWIESYAIYEKLDITVTLKDLHNADDNFRAAIRLSFEDGQVFSVSLTNDHSNDDATTVYALQNMGDSFFNWKSLYTLTPAQAAKLTGKGITLRLVRVGEIVDVYLDGEHAYEYDLTCDKDGNASAVSDQACKLSLRLYGNAGETAELPFILTDSVNMAAVQIAEDERNAITTSQKNYLMGETVEVFNDSASAYYFTALNVDGEPVQLNGFGTYSFTAEKESYALSGSFAEKVFDPAAEWNAIRQNEGILSVPGSDGDSGWIESYAIYEKLDITVTLKDLHNADDNFRAAIRLSFEDGQVFSVSLTNDHSNDDATTVYALQNMGDSFFNWKSLYTLNPAQAAKLTGEGITLRLVREGSQVCVFLDDRLAHVYDLSADRDGNPSNAAQQSAKVSLRLYGNMSEAVTLPFVITQTVERVQILSDSDRLSTENSVIFLGDTVKLMPAAGCRIVSMTVDGEPVTLAEDGTYTFVAEKNAYNVASVTERLEHWQAEGQWDVSRQTEGILKKPVLDTNTGWMWTYDTGYRDISLTVADQKTADGNFNLTVIFQFAGGQKYQFRLTNDGMDGEYVLQNVPTNNTIISGWGSLYTLTEAQKTKLCAEGITLRAAVAGTVISFYVDGVQVAERELSQDPAGEATGISGENARLAVRLYGNNGVETQVGYVLSGEPETVTVTAGEAENGKIITPGFADYLPGETVQVTVSGNAGYAHDSFKVNGQDQMTDLYGNYSFAVAEDTTLSATFKASLFKSTVSGWLLENQHYGKVALTYTNGNGHSNWLDFTDTYTDLDVTLQAREYTDTAKPITRTALRFTFENGEVITFSIAKNAAGGSYKYSVQSLSGDTVVAKDHDFYIMNQAQIAKFNSADGIEFRVVRNGTKVFVELDGVLVVDGFDLTAGDSGITADMPMNVTIRRYDDPGIQAQYGIQVSKELPKVQITVDPAITGGTVTADKTEAVYGDTVTLTLTPDSGSYHDLMLNGRDVLVDWETGNYSFTATEGSYTVTGGFQKGLSWSSNDAFSLLNQHKEVLRLQYTGSGSGWIDATGNYESITVTAKDYVGSSYTSGEAYALVLRMTFSNGKNYAIRIVVENGRYAYQHFGASGSLSGWGGWKWLDEISGMAENINDKLRDTGVAFKMTRTDTNILQLSIDGVVVETYTMADEFKTADVTSVGIRQYGNPDSEAYEVLLPYTLTQKTEE